MAELSILHNGSTTLPLKRTENDTTVPDADVPEVHENNKEVVQDQIRHGVLADKKGYDRIFFTEHHFEPAGTECSTNPMMSQMAVAAQTDSIQLAQAANIITWHDPVRFAEQASLLDIVSNGRAEIGVGRGYQPRETEPLGQYWGGTVQDQEQNRSCFKEKWELLQKAWTEDLTSYHGEYHQVPPSHTKWHHEQDYEYFNDDVNSYDLEDHIDWKEGDFYQSSLWNPVVSGGSTLTSLFITPKPVQEPYPQTWIPMTTPRTIRWAAENGVNGTVIVEPNSRVKELIDAYMNFAEQGGWADRRPEYDGEPFKRGWDADRGRGVCPFRYIFNTEIASEEEIQAWKDGLEHQWDYYGPFGFAAVLAEADEEMYDPAEVDVDAEMLIDKEVALTGDHEEIIEGIETFKQEVGYEDLHFGCFFETPGVDSEVADAQLEHFAENVMPYLNEEYPTTKAVADD